MKFVLVVFFSILYFPWAFAQESPVLNWENFLIERIDLQLPLLIIQGSKGLLACAYIDTATCNKTGEACAIVSGVSSHDEMLEARVSSISDEAAILGVEIGMTGLEAIQLLE